MKLLGRRRRWWLWRGRKAYKLARSRLMSKRIERCMKKLYAPVIWQSFWDDSFMRELKQRFKQSESGWDQLKIRGQNESQV